MGTPRIQALTIGAAAIGILALSFILGSAVTSILVPPQAVAFPSCGSPGTVQGARPDTNGRGVRVSDPGMRVSDASISCIRVSAIHVMNSAATRFAIVGWYERASGAPTFLGCPVTSGPPRVLVAKIFDGTNTCAQNTANITNTPRNDDFAVHDHDQDGTWKYYRNGAFIGSFRFGMFTTGILQARTERYQTGDSMYGLFDGLKRMNSNANWVDWTGTTVNADTDPDYNTCVLTATKVEIRLAAC